MGSRIRAPKEEAVLVGPYECPICHGCVAVEENILKQINGNILCPYCAVNFKVTLKEAGNE